jgi:hypothetical protein
MVGFGAQFQHAIVALILRVALLQAKFVVPDRTTRNSGLLSVDW